MPHRLHDRQNLRGDQMAALDTVLAKIDGNLDSALARLFKLIEIPSVSTDPAYARDCAKAAEWLAGELKSLGFEASVRKTAGHPIVVGQAKAARPDVPHVLFYGHYDVPAGRPARFVGEPAFRAAYRRGCNRQADCCARRFRRQGSAHDFRRSLPRLHGNRRLALPHHLPHRRRGGDRLAVASGFSC